MKHPEPERHPVRPPVLPKFEGQLARADVKPMTPSLDPSNLSQEAIMATLWTTVQSQAKEIAEIKSSLKWGVRLIAGCLMTALGGLFTALLHLGTYILTTAHPK